MEDHERWSRDDEVDCSISRVDRSGPVFRLNSPREMEKRSSVRSLSSPLLWFSLAGCKEIWRPVDVWPVDHVQAFSTSSIVTEPRDRFILVERCYDDFKLFDYSQIGRDVGGNCIWIQYY